MLILLTEYLSKILFCQANTSPANMQQKPQKQHRQLMMSKCSARECRDPARHHVKRRWLLKIRTGLQNQVNICNSITCVSSDVCAAVNDVSFVHVHEKYYYYRST